MTLLNRDTIDFLLHDWLGEDREHAAILDLAEQLATDQFLNHFKAADQDEAQLLDDGSVYTHAAMGQAMVAYREAGLFALSFPEDLGGPGLPSPVSAAASLFFAAANPATAGFCMLTAGNARLISRYGAPEQVATFAMPQIEGRWFGTMCLSEPEAGSSLADIRTRAEAVGDGSYRLKGNKMWISSGDHEVSENIVHLVLAKLDGAISLFIVPKYLTDGTRNHVSVAGLNHKMGYRGLPNCLLNFGEQEGAVGYLVGEAGSGLKIMFMMMNEARIAVGAGAAAIAARGYELSKVYAAERKQGRQDPKGPQVTIDQHPDVQRMLMQQQVYAEGGLALVLWAAKLEQDHSPLLDLITPVAKAWPSEFGVKSNDLAIQVHGGYGYTRDFDVEQLYRDQRLNPIHEGTNGIQAQDLLLRKIMKDQGKAFGGLMKLIAKGSPELKPWQDRLIQATQKLAQAGPAKAIELATPYQFAFSHLLLAHIWLSQAKLDAGRQAACDFFMTWELPEIGPKLDLIAANT